MSALGCATISAGAAYPPPRHPEDHMFTWARGRTLSAFQLVAIASGQGQLDLRDRSWRLTSGSVFLLPQGTWHRYRPDRETGWTEHWVELRGPAVDAWHAAGLLEPAHVNLRDHPMIWQTFADLMALCQAHPQGYRAIAASMGMNLLANTLARVGASHHPDALNSTVSTAKKLLASGHDVATVAKMTGVSYPSLYRHFKKATGLTPKAYTREVRLARAEELLSGSSMSIKEIAARLGYFSAGHFSQEFRQFRKMAPSSWPGRRMGQMDC